MKKKYLFLGLFFLFIFSLYVFLSSLFFRIEIPSRSMLPTLKTKEQLLVQRYTKWERGDILVFYSEEEQQYLIKRLIGLPGDVIEIKEGTVYLNGEYYPEPYLAETDSFSGEYTVPDGSLFFLGDNRKESRDSRFFVSPYINEDAVAGKAILRLYPTIQIMNYEGGTT